MPTCSSREYHRHHPAGVGSLQPDQPALAEPDQGPVGRADQQQSGEASEMGKMPDEHEIVRLRPKAFEPDRRVIVGSKPIGVFDVGVEHLAPSLGRLTGPRLARMKYPRRPHSELRNRVMRHAGNIPGTLVGERPIRVLVLGLGPPVLSQIELHSGQRRAQ
jgi:hypothetical protein